MDIMGVLTKKNSGYSGFFQLYHRQAVVCPPWYGKDKQQWNLKSNRDGYLKKKLFSCLFRPGMAVLTSRGLQRGLTTIIVSLSCSESSQVGKITLKQTSNSWWKFKQENKAKLEFLALILWKNLHPKLPLNSVHLCVQEQLSLIQCKYLKMYVLSIF